MSTENFNSIDSDSRSHGQLVFSDPVTYLAGLGIDAILVDPPAPVAQSVTEHELPAAA